MARKAKKKASTKKAKKTAKKAVTKRVKAPARKTKATKATKKAKKTTKTAKAAKRVSKAPTKAMAKKAVKKTAAKKKTAKAKGDVKGEGNYSASRRFRKKEEGFIARMGSKIAELGQEAKAALTGSEGKELEAAEASTRARGEGMDVPGDE
jgi:hypothetical protein